jgi:hypothetical protein
MNKERDYFYSILGLQPGATKVEIKAAYRRLAKLYHPDHDPSQDSEVMYREIRVAYEKLLKWDISDATDTKAKTKTQTGTKARTRTRTDAAGNRGSTDPEWTSEDWENWERKNFSKQFRKSQGRIFSNVFFAFLLVVLSCLEGMPYGNNADLHPDFQLYFVLVASYFIITWIILIFLPHFVFLSEWSLLMKFLGGILYGAILVFLVVIFYTISEEQIVKVWITASISVWVLMADFTITNLWIR